MLGVQGRVCCTYFYDGHPYLRSVSEKAVKFMLTLIKEIEASSAGGAKILTKYVGNIRILPMRFDYESLVAFYVASLLFWVAQMAQRALRAL